MSADDDRLASIEQRYSATIGQTADDLRWLLDRLREAVAARDEARADADARFAHSDHKAAKFYRRWQDAEKIARLAEESEAGWRRDADEAHAALARVEALADEWEREFRKAGYQGTLPPSITELRAALRGES